MQRTPVTIGSPRHPAHDAGDRAQDHEAIFVYPPGENTGGDLIRIAALRFLADQGLDVWESDGRIEAAAAAGDDRWLREFLGPYRGLIFFTGGGNVGFYLDNGEVRARVIAAASASSRILMFPQFAVAMEPALRDPRVTVWARDLNTHAMLRAGGVRTELVPDTALYLDPDFPKHPEGSGTLLIRRIKGRDQEYSDYDLGLEGFPTADPTYEDSVQTIIDTIKPYRSIVSDRLHGSLISLMLRKRVAMLPGGYLKSKGFYETWLRNIPGIRCVQYRTELNDFLASDETPQIDPRKLFLKHAEPALDRFLASARGLPAPRRADSIARRIIAIAGVKNEHDVIEAFVRHNSALVDHLIVLDNGSTDGTREILAALEAEGLPLEIRHGDSIGYRQSSWMTALMKEAARDPEAAWVLPIDADEFLPANIKTLLLQPQDDGLPRRPLSISVRTYIPDAQQSSEENPVLRIHHYLVSAPGPWGSKVLIPGETARLPGVVLEQGHHLVSLNSKPIESNPAGDQFVLAHFPVRSVEQFVAKFATGWLQLLSMFDRAENHCYHWRVAFERYKKDPAAFSANFREEALRFSEADLDADIVEAPADYLGGALKYSHTSPDPAYSLRQLLLCAEDLARAVAQLSEREDYVRRLAERAQSGSTPGDNGHLDEALGADLQAAREELHLASFSDSLARRMSALQTERDDLRHKLEAIEGSYGWTLLSKYRRWIAQARRRNEWVARIYEPAAVWILRKVSRR